MSSMILKTFLRKLQHTPRTWMLVSGKIRNKRGQCPIEAVLGLPKRSATTWRTRSGLTRSTENYLVNAADNRGRKPAIRKELLYRSGIGRDNDTSKQS